MLNLGLFFKDLITRIKYLKHPDTINSIPKSDILFFCQDVDRSDSKFGKPYSKLLDSIHEDLSERGLTCIHVGLPYKSKLFGELAWAKPYCANRIFFRAYLTDTFLRIFVKLGLIIRAQKDSADEKVYNKIYALVAPKIIFTIGASAPLCRAAKKRGIKIVEVLHGLGYDNIKWGWAEKLFNELPDYILSLDRISTKSFKQLQNKGVIVSEIPHPWYKRFANGNSNTNADPKWLNNSLQLTDGKKVILVSLVWGYDGDHGEYECYANILPNGLMYDQLIEAIKGTQNKIFWCLRRHPVQIRSTEYDYQITFLNNLVNQYKNVEWVESTNATLLSMLLKCDGHVTMSSMSSYDAALMGVKTLLLCPTLPKGQVNELWFEDLVSKGYADKIKPDTIKIIKWVKQATRDKPIEFSDAGENDWKKILVELNLVV
jgi:hypothetical protein